MTNGFIEVWFIFLKLSITMLKKTTSGKFKIIHIYVPRDMQKAHQLIDRDNKTFYKT